MHHALVDRSISFICMFLAAALGASVLATSAWSQNQLQSYDEYKELLDQAPVFLDTQLAEAVKGVIERSYVAHDRRDTDASLAELGEDYSWIKVSAEGPKEMAKGLEITRELTRNLYESDFFDNYLGVDARPIAVIGNIGIQLEIEKFRDEDGSLKVMNTLAIYEIRGGKLWRLWAFAPETSEANSE